MGSNDVRQSALLIAATLVAASAALPAGAQEVRQQLTEAEAKALIASLKPQHGIIPLGNSYATLNIGNAYDFYAPADARAILERIWGNPPSSGEDIIGLVLPAGASPLSDAWGAVVSYENSGYVSDEDAASTDYNDLLKDLKEGTQQANEERFKQGYASIDLRGWAESPVYNKGAHSVIWATDLKFADASTDSLNYDMRSLGRNGVLSVNFLAGMEQLPQIKTAAQAFSSHVSFDNGFRYQDFDPSADKKAEYGIGGLIAAGVGVAVVKKLGIFAILLKFIKPILIAVAAAFAALRGKIMALFGKGRNLPD